MPSIAKYPVGVDPPLLEQPVFKAVLECGTLVPVSKLNSGETLARYSLFRRSNDVLRCLTMKTTWRDCADDVPGCTRRWLLWTLNEAYSPGSEGKITEKVIVSVKGGDSVSVIMIRDLAHVVDREKAKIGLFITLVEPTKPMQTEAVKTGFFETPYGKYAKIQILTIAELFAGAKPNIPLIDPTAFKRAAEELTTKQTKLF